MPKTATSLDDLAVLEYLVGRWTNRNFPGSEKGGPKDPYSYCVMPLPEEGGNRGLGYILKNFTYTEEITFNGTDALTHPVQAPNRGGTVQQTPTALFYDQQIKFAEGPDGPKHKDGPQVVHEENGMWLYLTREGQKKGPYPKQKPPPPVILQPPDVTLVKQISVPHGNAILALGSFEDAPGDPDPDASNSVLLSLIPNAIVLPEGIDTTPYTEKLDSDKNYQNPDPALTLRPNLPIMEALRALLAAAKKRVKPPGKLKVTIKHLHVTTAKLQHGQGIVTNIPFEQAKARVISYHADYYLVDSTGAKKPVFKHLLYTQTMNMAIRIDDVEYIFPHVTCNALTKA